MCNWTWNSLFTYRCVNLIYFYCTQCPFREHKMLCAPYSSQTEIVCDRSWDKLTLLLHAYSPATLAKVCPPFFKATISKRQRLHRTTSQNDPIKPDTEKQVSWMVVYQNCISKLPRNAQTCIAELFFLVHSTSIWNLNLIYHTLIAS